MGIRIYPQMSQISQNKINYGVFRSKILRHPSAQSAEKLLYGPRGFLPQAAALLLHPIGRPMF